MSGITGIFHLDGRPVDPRLLDSMSARMAHRGPDGSGSWIDGPVGLAHRMLHSTPESLREVQPLRDEGGQLVLVLDGRLDNREELKAAIEGAGGRLRDDSDAELVLKAYQCWDENCPQRLLGDFAFALWDARRHRLLCARDPLGNKPFFYHCDGKTLAFASEMQPLFADPAFPRRLNLPLVGMFLCYYYGGFEETLYAGVLRLPAAHCLSAEAGGLRKLRYWDVDPGRSITYSSDTEYAEHFLELFRCSVRTRVRAHGPAAISLSGGLDSSSIACTTAAIAGEDRAPGTRLIAFSQLYPGLCCDEGDYIQEVTRRWNLEAVGFPHTQDPSSTEFEHASDYPDVFYSVTRFMFTPAMHEMQRRGMRVLVEGMGGDELIAPGFGHLTDLMARGHWLTLLRQLRADSASSASGLTAFRLFLDYCVRPLVPGGVKAALRPLLRPFRGNGQFSLLLPSFARKHRLDERVLAGFAVPCFPSRAQHDIYHALFYGWNVLASEMDELFAARFGIECRFPFRDQRLLELLLAVPEEQRRRQGESKFLLRQAMVGLLPEKVRQRKDRAVFDVVLDGALGGRHAQPIQSLFSNSILVGMGIVDAKRLQQLLASYRARNEGLTVLVEFVVQLELFCRLAEGVAIVEQEAV